MSEIILVRHGQASFGKASYDKLSELGITQVRHLMRHWNELGESFDQIYMGSLQRQRETANELLMLVKSDPPLSYVDDSFNEYNGDPLIRIYLRDFSASEGLKSGIQMPIKDERLFQSYFEKATSKWLQDQLVPGENDSDFESWGTFKQRVYSGLDNIMSRHSSGSRTLISTSGGVIATALQRVLKFSDEQVIQTNWMVHNSSVTRIRYGNGKMSVTQFNSLPHLERKGMTDLITYR